HVVSRRGLAGGRRIRCGWAGGRPVVPSEHERREIDLMRELEEPFQCRGPGIERARPGLYVRDVLKTPRQRLQQLLLLRRRAQEEARLVHAFLPDRRSTKPRPGRVVLAGKDRSALDFVTLAPCDRPWRRRAQGLARPQPPDPVTEAGGALS